LVEKSQQLTGLAVVDKCFDTLVSNAGQGRVLDAHGMTQAQTSFAEWTLEWLAGS